MCVILATIVFKYFNVHVFSYYFTVTFISMDATCDSEFKLSWPLHILPWSRARKKISCSACPYSK